MKADISNKEKFEKFHKENPHIFAKVLQYSRALVMAGRKRLSISLIIERIRWDSAVSTTGDRYKICNTHRAFYVRKLEAEYPEFVGMFSKKQQRTV